MEARKEIIRIETAEAAGKRWEETKLTPGEASDCMHMICLYPEAKGQEIKGFGGAFTEASAHNFYGLSEDKQQEILEDYFGEKGLCYNVGRIPMNSCDFGLGNYAYVEEGDKDLSTFSVAHDEKEIIPLLRAAIEKAKEYGQDLEFLLSPWSPPAYMKTNKDMNHGGKLLPEYRSLWAKYYAKFMVEYAKRGISITGLTVQNEPEAVQTWDSCIWTAEEEAAFVADYLGPTLAEEGLGSTKIFIWDHNKENVVNRVSKSMANAKARDYIHGAAVHWYTGDHFDGLRIVGQLYPQLELIFSEGCVEYSRFADTGETRKAQMYAHDMIGNLQNGVTTYYDWNLLLDAFGGPNHVGNFCAAPLMADLEANTYEKRLTYYYIGHFSRYIKKGARLIGSSTYTGNLECTAFENPDGSHVLIVLNPTDKTCPVCLNDHGMGCSDLVAGHSIVTYLLPGKC